MRSFVQKLVARFYYAGAIALAVPTFAQTHPPVDAFVAKLDNSTRAIHESAKKDSRFVGIGCRELLNEILDLDVMTQAANVEIWEQMTPPQRDIVRAAFE